MLIALGLSLLFFLLELFGGIWSNSLAILSDSFHLLTDVVSLVISLSAVHLATRKPCHKYTFGHGRFEILGALTSILLIYGCTLWLIVEAVDRIRNPAPLDGKVMFSVAFVGVLFNFVLIFVLHHHHGHHGSHDHVHSHEHEDLECSHDDEGHHDHRHHHHHSKSVNIRAAVLHVIGDLISSIGVLIASIFILVDQSSSGVTDGSSKFYIVDPICTFVFSLIVFATTLPLLKECWCVLMEANTHIDRDSVINIIENEMSLKVIDFKCWSVSMTQPYCIVIVQSPLSSNYSYPQSTAALKQVLNNVHAERKGVLVEHVDIADDDNSSGSSSPESETKEEGFRRPLIKYASNTRESSPSKPSQIAIPENQHSLTSISNSFDQLAIAANIKQIVMENGTGIPLENIYVVFE